MIESLLAYFSISYESLLVLIVTAVSCAILSPFLVLRKLSMVSDAISHSVLLGIVVAFFIVKDVGSPFLIVGAGLFGVITVFVVEFLSGTGMVKNDDAVGIVFPMFFALAVVLITKFARNVHLDTDIVLMGEVIIAPLNRTEFLGMDLPKAFVQMGILLIVNLLFIIIFFKELKVTTFDKGFAKLAGFSSVALFYALMTLSSLTAVTAFDAVGAILVVSFLITPGAAAYLISKDLKIMIVISIGYAVINSVLGYVISLLMNVSMSGMTAAVAGVTFLLTFLFNKEGLITAIFIRCKRKSELRLELFLIHIGNHIGKPEEIEELGLISIREHLKWKQADVDKIAKRLMKRELIRVDGEKNIYSLTERGRDRFSHICL
ncbi:MAG: metal ABC transporter permease [Catonella sp.]|uniref:metal ABC transporter permease n=1 Tax=Catonella sp. TaxID=2382125 RepID=UPI003FA04896